MNSGYRLSRGEPDTRGKTWNAAPKVDVRLGDEVAQMLIVKSGRTIVYNGPARVVMRIVTCDR
jgi:hypothetical protein